MTALSDERRPTRPVMRYHGGKWRMSDWIIEFFPPHFTYVEPFGGSAGVLMRKPRSSAEVYNDLDADIVNVFSVLRDRDKSQELQMACALTPYARSEFDLSYHVSDDPVERARRTVFRAFSGFGSAGATKGKTGFRSYSGSGRSNPPAIDWLNYPVHISAFCQRMQGVLIESRPALDVVDLFDAKETLFYVDPPYLMDTRNASGACYVHEMTDNDHKALLNRLLLVKGMVVLSGYATVMYDEMLLPHGWQRVCKSVQACGHQGSVERTECLWISPACQRNAQQQVLF
ncbi:DNA adenine methylase [Acidithiobacillus thiooxidans]|uniref:DNA adenine methylase n=1 Tax=Acidithiobacillus thiooxidans TaxID=930 RepID=UPI001C0768AA|nr:DNA adenine methylase [Acidithiobacillus thiooxidans]MBU2840224.1 DNA adenine methylase [Acidithiobacillus thiooxidans]